MSNRKQLPRKIAVVTGTRAEYGLLYLLLKEIQSDIDCQLQLIVTGMHLSPEFGSAYHLIVQDGFNIDAKVEMLLASDTATGVAKSVAIGILGFTDAFERLKPDIIVVLGDRFEILAVVQTAMIMKIPVAHIHGGELTQGAIDESIRHAITKMAQLHFTAAEPYRNRVIQMGEQPDRVFNVGAPGLERIKRMTFLNREELEKKLQCQLKKQVFLLTYHPATLELQTIDDELKNLFSALNVFPEATIIITKSNSDEAGRRVNQRIDDYVKNQPERVYAFTTMGDQNYLNSLRLADVVIGNSSSGVIEAPVFHVPTVNIGGRQDGRLRCDSIIDCGISELEIRFAIEKALSSEFKAIVKNTISPYDHGETSKAIKNTIKASSLKKLVRKTFYDVGVNRHEKSENNDYCRSGG